MVEAISQSLLGSALLGVGAASGAALAVVSANRAQLDGARVSSAAIGVCAAGAALSAISAPSTFDAAKACVLAAGLSYLSAFDLRALAIPVWPALALIVVGLGWALGDGALIERLAAACAGAGAFLGLDLVYQKLRGRSGLGAGDALIAGALGAWLSFDGLVWGAAFGGALGLVWQILRGAPRDTALPFVPALSAGAGLFLVMERWLS